MWVKTTLDGSGVAFSASVEREAFPHPNTKRLFVVKNAFPILPQGIPVGQVDRLMQHGTLHQPGSSAKHLL